MGGKRKIDPVTGKCVLAPSDIKRKKRPKHKKNTPEQNAVTSLRGAASTKQAVKKRSVKAQKVYHIVSFDGSN